MPNFPSFPTCCVDLELRPLPSIGITRLHRYYEPLRHPVAPGLTLAGFRLILRLTTLRGFPCCVCLPLPYMPSPLPRRICSVRVSLTSLAVAAFPVSESGRHPHQLFRGLLSVHSRYGLHVRQVPYRTFYTRGFSRFVAYTTAPVASGRSERRRAGFAPAGKHRPCTAHSDRLLAAQGRHL